jgi:hypothetical protein
MTPGSSVHLSEEALNDVLIGLASPDANAHVAFCELCRRQVEQFRDDMRLFDETSLAWSKSKAANKIRVLPPWGLRQAILAPVGWAMAAAVLVMLAIPSLIQHRSDQHGPVATTGTEYGDSAAQIAQDNELLRSVDIALNPNEDSTLHEYGLSQRSTAYRKLTSHP